MLNSLMLIFSWLPPKFRIVIISFVIIFIVIAIIKLIASILGALH